ncbi:shikimate kinase [Wenyingzhuangia heitensis]|uniref:Shikimate kinase n=1 Tax=Wenyingzhuangia heitensis TaxID=1487859 RepID=A0ABX0UDS7_9FLAO|nr:shikimate kinase [Wenyingzhuangia heitensis]NIJ46040.1 shikimate kinase [Wenyingzhuangia heitensis]
MKLILLGYMGCGKSAISKSLSHQLNSKRIDLDDYIEKREGMKIADIFAKKGEIYFRKLETTCLEELLDSKEDFILSLGGGTPCFGTNMELINEKSTSVYLSANIPTLVARLLPEKSKRPLIARINDDDLPEFIGKHLFERRPFYLQAKIAVSVDQKSVNGIAKEIVAAL